MNIAVVIQDIVRSVIEIQPWIFFKDILKKNDVNILVYHETDEPFSRGYDAMLLHVWQDWQNLKLFNRWSILPLMEKYAIYRAEFPETIQIILNSTDMSRRPYATPYWRAGDPVLYRTPAYDRRELYPFPPDQIWAYEKVWGRASFVSDSRPRYRAGFIGSNSGPKGYRKAVAEETARVGIGICKEILVYERNEYDCIMSDCQIIVCPRGWGEQSSRHWDAWLSAKPILTDRDCDSVEMIPGLCLQENKHYLVFDDPKDIPDIVSDWTRPSRCEELSEIAKTGRRAALSYDALERITQFFNNIGK